MAPKVGRWALSHPLARVTFHPYSVSASSQSDARPKESVEKLRTLSVAPLELVFHDHVALKASRLSHLYCQAAFNAVERL